MNFYSGKRALPFKLFISFIVVLSLLQSLTGFAALTESEIENLLVCYQDQLRKTEGKSKYELATHALHTAELYKLFIDKERLAKPTEKEKGVPPHLIFDVKEPGYHQSMTDGFRKMSENIGTQLSLNFLIGLHDTAVGEVKDSQTSKQFQKGLSNKTWNYGVVEKKLNPSAMEELVASKLLFVQQIIKEKLNPKQPSCIPDSYVTRLKSDFLSEYQQYNSQIESSAYGNRDKIERDLQPFFQHYYKSVEKTQSLNGKLMAIAELLRSLEIYHIFPDGNQRTYAFLLLNKLLIENNIPPVILDDPTLFDGYFTVEQMGTKIRQGIYNFLNESESSQKKFLATRCQSSQSNLEKKPYLKDSGSDYLPYFKKVNTEALRENFINRLKERALSAIQSNRINWSDNSNENHLTLLQEAIILDDPELIELLLKNGADPSAGGISSAISTAIQMKNEKLAYRLIEKTNPQDKDSETFRYALALALTRRDPDTLKKIEPMKTLIAPLIKLGGKDLVEKWSAQLISDVVDHPTLLEAVVKGGLDINAKNPYGNTPLIEASSNGSLEQVNALLKYGADVNIRNKDQKSALTYAITEGSVDIIKRLLEANATITPVDLKEAEKVGNPEIKALLSKK